MMRNLPFKSPFLLGFEHLEQLVERSARTAGDGYPPYNIEASQDGLTITLAVAGFTSDMLAVTLTENLLAVRGRRADSNEGNFMHRGIAARPFERSFVLADCLEVRGANLEHGMLRIELARRKVETRTRNIEIISSQTGAGSSQGT